MFGLIVWASSPRSAHFFYARGKVRRYRYTLKRRDVRTARVSLRDEAESSAQGSTDDAQHLPQALSDVTLTDAPEEHVPMRANMLYRRCLPKYVRTFQMRESDIGLPS